MTISNPNREISYDNYVTWAKQQIEKDILSCSADYIINVNQQAFIDMLTTKYSVYFEVYYNTERLELESQQQKREVFHDAWGYEDYKVYTEYHFCLKYKYTGDIVALQIEPRCFHYSTMFRPTPINVVGDELQIRFIATEADTKKIQNLIGETKSNAFGNLDNNSGALWQMNQYNEHLPEEIRRIFNNIRSQRIKEHQVFLELGVSNLHKTAIEVPIIKKITPIPLMTESKEISYKLKEEIYRDILQHIYQIYKGYEKQTSTYRGKQEQELRDLIVPPLNSSFIGINSSGETFNKYGKTDIITKAPDNSNVFIAECKIWRGESQLSEAIDQLLKYVTWRDTQTALILFVKNLGITEIVEKAKNTIMHHRCFFSENGNGCGDSSFSYIFHTAEDDKCYIALELMLFHFPE